MWQAREKNEVNLIFDYIKLMKIWMEKDKKGHNAFASFRLMLTENKIAALFTKIDKNVIHIAASESCSSPSNDNF